LFWFPETGAGLHPVSPLLDRLSLIQKRLKLSSDPDTGSAGKAGRRDRALFKVEPAGSMPPI